MMPMSPEALRQLSSGRWLIPILAAMAAEHGSRFSVLGRRLAMSKSILSRSLDRLEELELIAPNPGHGHPLRPEYLLTEQGRSVAEWARTIVSEQLRLDIAPRTLGRWSLPVLAELRNEPKRFTALQRSLAPVTPRALSLELTGLRSAQLISRFGPEPFYGLTGRGLQFAGVIGAA